MRGVALAKPVKVSCSARSRFDPQAGARSRPVRQRVQMYMLALTQALQCADLRRQIISVGSFAGALNQGPAYICIGMCAKTFLRVHVGAVVHMRLRECARAPAKVRAWERVAWIHSPAIAFAASSFPRVSVGTFFVVQSSLSVLLHTL